MTTTTMMGRALLSVPSTTSMISTGGDIGIIPFPTSAPAPARRCSSGLNSLDLHYNHNQCGTRSVHLLIPKPPPPTNPIPLTVSAVLSSSSDTEYPKVRVGASSTGPIPSTQLIQVVESAASTGAQVAMDAVNKPRNIAYKGSTDLVTDTDKASEAAILEVVRKNFGDHLILGEEGGIIGDTSSDYLWCIDPLDGTTNFAHGYPSFAVSVGVLFQGKPAAAAVVEFVGGPMAWNTRMFSATTGGGAFCNGQKIYVSQTDLVEQSLLVTGFGYEHDDAWATNIELFKQFTDISRGVRRLGAAAVDMCHVALGIVEAYWEYRLKPWDMAAGVLIVEEAGGTVTRMDGGKFSVFERSVLVSNGVLHAKMDSLLTNMRKLYYIKPKLVGNLLEQVASMKGKGCPANAKVDPKA